MNLLYYGDNLEILRRHIADETIDLVYLDPPFKSERDYNVLFEEQNGTRSAAQIEAFEDTWQWDLGAAQAFDEIVSKGPERVSLAMQAFRKFLGACDMLAYLSMMAPRLVELRRVLKPTGSIYLHCDPTASHYLKLLMDAAFRAANFRNELVWCYKSRPQPKRYFGRKHEVILFYAASEACTFNWQAVARPLTEATRKKYRHVDEAGRRYRLQGRGITGSPIRSAKDVALKWETTHPELVVRDYLDEKIGVGREDWWADIGIINQAAAERLGYPTQKPEALLERIIKASSNEGDWVLDPFCGCGTTISVAQRLNRRWIGIDITHLAISLIKQRLLDAFGSECRYEVHGAPRDVAGARALAAQDRFQFQIWASDLVGSAPRELVKGADRGIDGRIFFHDEGRGGKTKQIVVSVKSGSVSVKDIRDLRGVVEREDAAIGVLVTLEESTSEMRSEAAGAGFYKPRGWSKRYPRIQILAIEELLAGKRVQYPSKRDEDVTFKKAPRAKRRKPPQGSFSF